ncbi:hypothetical protein KJ590_04395, partial [Patescibacteria group bacterium]|nr:hypothetical protein [Patescibacteria group bacterium]
MLPIIQAPGGASYGVPPVFFILFLLRFIKAMQTEHKSTRIHVFLDYWNIQITLNERVGEESGTEDCRVKID